MLNIEKRLFGTKKIYEVLFIVLLFAILILFVNGCSKIEEENRVIKIEQEQIETLIDKTESCVIYLGKSDCATCEVNYPILEDLAKKYNQTIYYYDATADLEEDHDNTLSVIHQYGLTMAPSVIISENGNIVKTLEGDVLEDIRAYLKNGELKDAVVTVDGLIEISLKDLDELLINEGQGMVYFYRDDCADCEKYTPAIIQIIEDNNGKVFCYNTSDDREHNYEEMMDVLNSYQVTSVPSFVLYENGAVIKVYSGDNIVWNVQDYFSDTENVKENE